MSSILSMHVKRLGSVLRSGAEDQVEESKNKFESAKDLYGGLLSELMITKFDSSTAYQAALQLFGSTRVKFAAVDGSLDQQLIGGLAVFWGGSYASTGTIEFRENAPPHVDYATGFIERGLGVSSCIPIYVDRIHEVDQKIATAAEPGLMTVTDALTEQAVVDNSTIANWIMTFSEFYLAYKLVVEEDVKILFLDRSLSATHTGLVYDTSRRSGWKTDGAIHGFEVDGIPIDTNEMAYGRHHLVNARLQIPPARGDYIRYAIIYHLTSTAKPMKAEQICKALGVDTEDRKKRILKYLSKAADEGYLTESRGGYTVNPRYAKSWERIKKLVITLGDHLFDCTSGNPMRIKKGEDQHWLTTQDLAFLTLYCFNMIVEECWRRKILLLGVTKDTTGRDFQNHLLPVGLRAGIWKAEENKLNIPSTDRMLLQAMSFLNHEKIPTPWSLIEYDSAFRVIVPDTLDRGGFVSGAIRNRITPERVFLKTYVQLDEAKTDPQLRSNVLFIDRLVHPEFDGEHTMPFKQEFGGAVEPVETILYRDKTIPNRLQNLVMVILSAMGARSIPEVFGHNKALFIADKIAKGQRLRVKGLIDATGHMLMNSPKLRRFTFYMHTFRERRAQVEYTRG